MTDRAPPRRRPEPADQVGARQEAYFATHRRIATVVSLEHGAQLDALAARYGSQRAALEAAIDALSSAREA